MKKVTFLFLLTLSIKGLSQTATSQDYIPNVMPVPPSAFQFIKSDEMPVSEYTGVPEISIPVFTVREGSFSLPINLSYHAGGVRVAEEAGWVGLNWNLDVGSVTQLVNDRDDLNKTSYTTIMPDYYILFGGFNIFPPKYSLDMFATPGTPPTPSTGISQTNPNHSFIIYSDYYVPVNGNYDQQFTLFNAPGYLGGGDFVDSEPDVFKANFNGHSIQFVIDPTSGAPVVLNKKTYQVVKTTNASGNACWKITAPDGVQYYFEQIDVVTNAGGCTTKRFAQNCSGQQGLASRVWHLTRAITTTNRTIKFTWSTTSSINDFPAFSQQELYRNVGDTQSIFPQYFTFIPFDGFSGNPDLEDISSINTTLPMVRSYLDSIKFSNGFLLFKKSSTRTDVLGDERLDSIIINNSWSPVKKFALSYDYFTGQSLGMTSGVIGNKQPSELSQRLKLVSYGEVGLPAYQFNYDATTLPLKTSFATDYWGFYNGMINNISFVPNPAHLGMVGLGSNGNDHNSYVQYARAANLTEMVYPTGGKVDFTYELNRFTNNWNDTISIGNGLRVKAVVHSTEFGVVKQIDYNYIGGQIMNPAWLHTSFSFTASNAVGNSSGGPPTPTFIRAISVDQFSGNGFYSSSLLSSGNYVGYSRVTKQIVDTQGNSSGSIVSSYTNLQDMGAYDAYSGMVLPSRKNVSFPDNGLLLMQKIFDDKQNLLSNKTNNYQFHLGPVYYGAKVSFNDYTYWVISGDQYNQGMQYSFEQDIVGYYPLYSGESLLQSSQFSTFSGTDSVSVKEFYDYNSYNLVNEKFEYNSKGEFLSTNYSYPPDVVGAPYMSNLVALNILDHPISIVEQNNNIQTHYKGESYSSFNGLILLSTVSEVYGAAAPETRLIIDGYDNFGNIAQYHKPNDVVQSFIWGYNSSLPIAETKNATLTQTAYTGFETQKDLGNWTYAPAISPPIGKTGSYGYAGTSVVKTGLPSGNYIISFWALSNSSNGTLSGSISASVTSANWQYYSFVINGITSVTLNLSNVTIDDLALCPVGAQMTFYTHKPLVGTTSQTDANYKTTYFQYDEQQRLQTVTDYQGNILKNYSYNYKTSN